MKKKTSAPPPVDPSPALATVPADLATEFRISAAQRIADCPGSVRACAGLADIETPAGKAGTRIHKALAAFFAIGVDSPEFAAAWDALESESEKGTFDELAAKTREVIADHGGLSAGPLCEISVAFELWRGHPDFVALCADQKTALALDWKSGRGDVPPAPANAQLRGYLLGVQMARPFEAEPETYVCGIIQAGERPDLVSYGSDTREARKSLEEIAAAAFAPDAPRIPTPAACQYCRAAGTSRCPESFGLALDIIRANMPEFSAAPAQWLVAVARAGRIVSNIAERAENEIKARLTAEPSSVPGAALKPGAMVRHISAPETLFERIQAAGVAISKLVAADALKFGIGNLEKALGKAAAESMLSGLVEKRQNKPSLEIQ